MPFPKKLPRKVIKDGELVVAQMRFQQSKPDVNSSFLEERFIFLVANAVGNCCSFIADYNRKTGRLVYRAKAINVSSTMAAVDIGISIEDWKQFHLAVVECEACDDTKAGREFLEHLLRDNPELKPVVRVGRREELSACDPERKPLRVILSRSAWMARHYPNHNNT